MIRSRSGWKKSANGGATSTTNSKPPDLYKQPSVDNAATPLAQNQVPSSNYTSPILPGGEACVSASGIDLGAISSYIVYSNITSPSTIRLVEAHLDQARSSRTILPTQTADKPSAPSPNLESVATFYKASKRVRGSPSIPYSQTSSTEPSKMTEDTSLAEKAQKILDQAVDRWSSRVGKFYVVAIGLTCGPDSSLSAVKAAICSTVSKIEQVGDVEFFDSKNFNATGRVYTSAEHLGKRIEGTLSSLLKNKRWFPNVYSAITLKSGVGLDPLLLRRLVTETRQRALDSIDNSLRRVSQHLADKLRSVLDEDEYATDKVDEISESTKVFKSDCQECKANINSLPVDDEDAVVKIQNILSNLSLSEKQAVLGLPIYSHKETIVNQVRDNQVSVFVAETGSGKSTQIVQFLHTSGLFTRKIACTQPRRLAARSLADYVAQQMGSRSGGLVGAMVSGRPVAKETNIVYMTDFQLLQLCVSDQALSEYDCVVVDEAHERNLHTDLIIGLLKRALELRPKLRVLITSATINPDLFLNFYANFSTAHDKIPGRVYKVDVYYSDTKMDKSERYYERAVSKVVELCKNSKVPHGNMLVFLTTPRDTEIASDLCSKRLKGLPGTAVYSVYPLHGQLQPEDQKLAMSEVKDKKTRKIIFATNCAETSLTIPGVVVVVDSGLSKQNTFDPAKNMDTLVVGEISRNSADQRKGRAGRTQNGCCYRLYTEAEYKAMNESTTPEIQRIDLAGVALRILEFGLDPLNFYYLTPPSKVGLEKALSTLQLIGATEDGRLTELGRQIAKIPTEPRLAKMIILCSERGLAMEGMVVASLISLAGQVFFRGKTDVERQEATKTKEFYAADEGDLFTSMQVFKDWQSQAPAKRTRWSLKNCVNNKSMRAVEEMVSDVQRALKHDSKKKLSFQFSDVANAGSIVQECIYRVYSDYLCVYSGNYRIGFVQINSGQRMLVHPSSVFSGCVSFLLAVYTKLLKTEQTYLLNITPVSVDWISASDFLQPDKIFSSIARIMPVSTEVLKRLIGRGRAAIKKVEDEIRHSIKPEVFEIHCNFELHSVDLVCQPATLLLVAKKATQKAITDVISSLCNDEHLSADQTQLPCTIRLAPGFIISQLHLTGESNLVKVQFRQENKIITTSVLDAVTDKYSGNEIGQIHVEKHGSVLFLKTESPIFALRLVEKVNKAEVELMAQIRPFYSHARPEEQRCDLNELKLKLTFPRRYPTGTATVEFDSVGVAKSLTAVVRNLSLTHLWLSPVDLNRNDPEKLMIFNVPLWIEESRIKEALITMTLNYDLIVNPSVRIQRENPDRCLSKESARLRVINIFRAIFDQPFVDRDEDYQIAIRDPPNPGLYDWSVIVCFRFDEDYVRFAKKFDQCKSLERYRLIDMNRYSCGVARRMFIQQTQNVFRKSDFAATSFALLFPPLIVANEIYSASQSLIQTFVTDVENCSEQFPWEIQQLLRKSPVKVAVKTDFCERYRGREIKKTRIDIETNDLTAWSFTYQHLRKCLKPFELDCSRSSLLKSLLLKSAETELRRMLPESAHIIFDVRRESLSIYGSEVVKSKCQILINSYLDTREALCIREIPLSGANRARGLIRRLLKAYGRDMSGLLSAHSGVTSAELDITTRSLVLCGESAEAVAHAVEAVEQLAADAALTGPAAVKHVRVPGTVDLDCPVCLGPPTGPNGEAAETATLCGHAYCAECLQLQASSAGDVPLLCAAENCGKPLHVYNDIINRAPEADREQLHRRLLSLAVKRHVADPKFCLQFCPTPDCQGLLRDLGFLTGVRDAKCSACRSTFCLE